jgi:hypothetical protein
MRGSTAFRAGAGPGPFGSRALSGQEAAGGMTTTIVMCTGSVPWFA